MSNFGRWKTSFALETGSCWQSFLQNKQKFCEVWTWPKSGVAPLPPPPSSSRECSPSVICSVGHFQVPKYFALLIAKPSCKNEFYLSMASPIMALASHSASALKQTLGARLAGATRKRECSPIFRHGTVGTFDDLGPVNEHLNGLDGSGSWENLQCSPKIPRQNSYNSEFLFERVVTERKNCGGWYRVTWLCNQAQPCSLWWAAPDTSLTCIPRSFF